MTTSKHPTDALERGPSLKRRAVMKAAGVATVGLGMLGTTGTAAATGECVECVFFGKVEGEPELGDIYEFSKNGTAVAVRVTGVTKEDGEVVQFSFVTTGDNRVPVCKLEVKGGPNTRTRTFDPPSHSGGASAPKMHGRNPNRTRYAISNVKFYFCHPYIPG